MENILQVVGYKNAGKTTIIEQLLDLFTATGYRVSTIKHHGHGGTPTGNTDSDRFSRLGAQGSLVEGDGHIHLYAQRSKWSLDELIQIHTIVSKPTLILVEGWKHGPYRKIVLLRTEADIPLLQLENICCALIHEQVEIHSGDWPFPIFSVANQKEYQSYLMRNVKKGVVQSNDSINKRSN
ncbi:molybdopterin-guanine dinucleotide biosynthesis protein MobB [Bacillus sp. JCM 19046]|nr:molybdopterin-guanine dinucleotide biosynthesis protein MobB [Bacillus sp. JCM 19045]GAF17539.1 molybdopterin-guanine dinucleotide biosynthesis protein MobB [Bacillus sp. JCM 19046]